MQPSNPQALPPEIQQRVASQLRDGETQVWAAQPIPRLLSRRMISISLGGLALAGFALFWIITTHLVHQRMGQFADLFAILPIVGLPFLLIGLVMAAAPVWAAKRAARTAYVLTDQRAIMFRCRWSRGVTVHSYEPGRLTSIERDEAPDGTGDLIFEQFVEYNKDAPLGPNSRIRRGFLGIADVRAVEELVHQTLLKGAG